MLEKLQVPIRILITEAQDVLRCGLTSILDQQQDLDVIAQTSSCKQILSLTTTDNPDVILLDSTLTDNNSQAYISQLKNHWPECKILIFTLSTDKDLHLRFLQYGAVGIVLKNQSAELICKAIRNVHLSNELWIDRSLIGKMWKQHVQLTAQIKKSSPTVNKSNPSTALSSPVPLTLRENQIACLSAEGFTAKQIGIKLFICEKTVRNQLTIIYRKLNVKNQIELAINSIALNLCEH